MPENNRGVLTYENARKIKSEKWEYSLGRDAIDALYQLSYDSRSDMSVETFARFP